MAALSLREQLLALAGVAEAEVDGDDGSPSGVRIRLAPEADASAVGAEVQRVLAARGVRSRLGPEDAAPVLPAAPPRVDPGGLSPGRPIARRLHSVIVEESASALQVTVVDSDGRRAMRSLTEVGEAGLVEAVIDAVGMLLAGSVPRVLSVGWGAVDGSRVVTVVLEGGSGRRGAGAGLVRASLAYAVARAAWAALGD